MALLKRVYSDEAIIKGLKEGGNDEDRFLTYLYRHVKPSVKRFILRNQGTEKDADDIFQDGLIVFRDYVIKDKFHKNCTIKTFIYSICRNLWLKVLKDQGKALNFIKDKSNHVEVSEEPGEIFNSKERWTKAMGILDKLGGQCKKLLMYIYYYGMKPDEVCERMQFKNAQIVYNAKNRCKNKLAQLFRDNPQLKN